jgi:PTS system nitrogen regulatory IIA component
MDLKIKDVAELLNVSETTIRRWLPEGKIPSYRIDGQHRFSRGEIQNWVVSRHPPQNESQEEDSSLPIRGGNKQFSLYRAIHKGGIIQSVPGKTKEEVIRTAMGHIAHHLHLDAEGISDLLMDRENLQPTALNNGIGVPHTRDFLLNAQDVVTVVFPEHPIDYGALDGKPVHTLFFLFACEDKRHLHLLAKIAHLCNQPATLDLLKTKPSKEAFLAYIKEWEVAVF